MKATKKLVENIAKEDFRKCKIDLQHAIDHTMKVKIHEKKQDLLKKYNSGK